MSKIWVQSLKGSAIDLVDVDPRAVDFREMCEQLAQINLHCGAGQSPVSSAVHTLIALDCAEEAVKPWVALHRFHEARIGAIPRRTRQALIFISEALGGQYTAAMQFALGDLPHRHDVAIHAAAGLPMPTADQARLISIADLRADATERRDFLADSPGRLLDEQKRAAPSSRVYRLGYFGKSPFDVAQALYRQLETLLPTLMAKSTRPAVAAL